MLQLSIYFESNTDDVAEWLNKVNVDLSFIPYEMIGYPDLLKELHKYVMENFA